MDLDPRAQVRKRVPTLTVNAQELREISPKVVNDFGEWSALKLILHVATVNMYTTVVPKTFDDWFYVDALAGSGVSVYGDMENCFKGSAILAAENAEEQFTKMYFIEQNRKKASVLRERLDAVFNGETDIDVVRPECGYEVRIGDANEELPQIAGDMYETANRGPGRPWYNHLTFIDNQGIDINWDAIEEFSSNTMGDFLVTFQSSRIRQNQHLDDTLNEYFGSEIWKTANSLEDYAEAYGTRFNGISKSKQVMTTVDSGVKNYQYEVIYATKDDAGGYVNAVSYVSDFVERVTGADVGDMIDVMYGDQSRIGEYLPERDSQEDQDAIDEQNSQSSLGEF